MPDGLADQLDELKTRDEEAQEAVKQVIEDALTDTDLISVQSVTQSTTEGSVQVKLNYSGLEHALAERDEFDDLNLNVRSGDIHVRPEGNP